MKGLKKYKKFFSERELIKIKNLSLSKDSIEDLIPNKFLKKIVINERKTNIDEILELLSKYNLDDSLKKLSNESHKIIFNKESHSNHMNQRSMKEAFFYEGGVVHQYGLSLISYFMMISNSTNTNKKALSYGDIVYLCKLVDICLPEERFSQRTEFYEFINRKFYSRFRYEIGIDITNLGRAVFIFNDLIVNIKGGEELKKSYEEQNGFSISDFFYYGYIIFSLFAINGNLLNMDIITQTKYEFPVDINILIKVLNSFCTNKEEYTQIDQVRNDNVKKSFPENIFNPFIVKPILKLSNNSFLLVNNLLMLETLSQRLNFDFKRIKKSFKQEFYGPTFESYIGFLLEKIYDKKSIIKENDFPNKDFHDFSISFDKKIISFEVKSLSESLSFNQFGNVDLLFNESIYKRIEKSILKFCRLFDSKEKELFKSKFGENYLEKKLVLYFIFDIKFISNQLYRKTFFKKKILVLERFLRIKYGIKIFFLSVDELVNYVSQDVPHEELDFYSQSSIDKYSSFSSFDNSFNRAFLEVVKLSKDSNIESNHFDEFFKKIANVNI